MSDPQPAPDPAFQFTGTCLACGELVADGRTVHRSCESDIDGRITPPPGLTADELANHAADMEALERDPRTAGAANRPAWLVARVLRAAGRW